MYTITVHFLEEERSPETYTGTMQVLSCGVLEITEKVEASSTLIASLEGAKTVGIPLVLVSKYEIAE